MANVVFEIPKSLSANCSNTHFSGTDIQVSIQKTQQQQRDILQQAQQLNGHNVVKCVIDAAGCLKQTPLKGT